MGQYSSHVVHGPSHSSTLNTQICQRLTVFAEPPHRLHRHTAANFTKYGPKHQDRRPLRGTGLALSRHRAARLGLVRMEPMLQSAQPRPVPPPVAGAFNADTTLVTLGSPARRRFSAVTSVVALGVYAAYLVYRAAFTLNPDALVFSLAVYFAELHGFISLFLYFHQVWHLRGRRVVPPPGDLKVDVFVTTYNEDVDLLRQTLRAAVAIRYPHGTYVLDDGRRPEVRALADEVGCHYLTRPDNKHAKAGNWNNAFRLTQADFIATFDADHVPRPEFLDRTLGFFRDAKVAIVQVPQQYHNLDSVQHRVSFEARRMYSEQDAFFNLVMPGKDHWNASFFCGTGAVLRREALEPHGGILTEHDHRRPAHVDRPALGRVEIRLLERTAGHGPGAGRSEVLLGSAPALGRRQPEGGDVRQSAERSRTVVRAADLLFRVAVSLDDRLPEADLLPRAAVDAVHGHLPDRALRPPFLGIYLAVPGHADRRLSRGEPGQGPPAHGRALQHGVLLHADPGGEARGRSGAASRDASKSRPSAAAANAT